MKLSDFFYFNRSDRTVLLFFLVLAVICSSLMFFAGRDEQATPAGAIDSAYVPKQPISSPNGQPQSQYFRVAPRKVERFAFDPNTADSTELLRLGLQDWQVRNIYKYRAAGGVYRRPQDFARLYGLTQKQYRELEPYIRISSDYAPAADLFPREKSAPRDTTRRYPAKLKATERIDLNLADTSELVRVPGVGSYFARQIVHYRQRLGGFYHVRQLLEIEDFPREAIPYFELSDHIQKININSLKLNELKRHPYINYYQAKAIMDYRRLRGPLSSLNDLRLLKDFTPEDIDRLNHYVAF